MKVKFNTSTKVLTVNDEATPHIEHPYLVKFEFEGLTYFLVHTLEDTVIEADDQMLSIYNAYQVYGDDEYSWSEYAQYIEDIKDFNDENDESFVPTAPDTSKFKATKGGKITIINKERMSIAYYAFTRNYMLNYGIKIGSNVENANELYEYALFLSALFAPNLKFSNSDKVPVIAYKKSSAFYWVGIGSESKGK